MLYQVTLLRSEEGYSVSCPSLPGCHSQGETKEEALENIKDAIAEYQAVVAEMQAAEMKGLSIPGAKR